MSLLMGTKDSQLTPGLAGLSHEACASTSELIGGRRDSRSPVSLLDSRVVSNCG